jgi:hypothetical protein
MAALWSEGLHAKTLELLPIPKIPLPGRHVVSKTGNILVKNWDFKVAAGVNTFGQVTRRKGIVSQEANYPWAYFANHVNTLVENVKSGENELYDPAYGSGPIKYPRVVGPPSVTDGALKKYQEANVAGYCARTRKAGTRDQLDCVEAEAARLELRPGKIRNVINWNNTKRRPFVGGATP